MENYKLSILISLLIFTGCNLGFKSERSPIEKLEFAVRLEETLQLFYWSNVLINGENMVEDPESDFPLKAIFPFKVTSYSGVLTGAGGEKISYDLRDCVNGNDCNVSMKIFYPGNSRIKERNLVVNIEGVYSDKLTAGVIYKGEDIQKMRDGSSRVVKFSGGNKGLICITSVFPPLSPFEKEEKCYYFSSITYSVSYGWFPGEVTYFTGTIFLDNGTEVNKISSYDKVYLVSPSSFSLKVTVGRWFDYCDDMSKKCITISISDGETFSHELYSHSRKGSPVLKREILMEKNEGLHFQQKIIYNDGHIDEIEIFSSGGVIGLIYNDFEGKISSTFHSDEITFAGRLQSDKGNFDFTTSSNLGGLWNLSYWWDKFDKNNIAPNEEGDLKYFLFSRGTGSVTVFNPGESVSATYNIDFFTGRIR